MDAEVRCMVQSVLACIVRGGARVRPAQQSQITTNSMIQHVPHIRYNCLLIGYDCTMNLLRFINPWTVIVKVPSRYRLGRPVRSIHTSQILLENDSNKSSDNEVQTKDGLKEETLPEVTEYKKFDLVPLPDENPTVPKKYVFQEVKVMHPKNPVFTIEKAAEPALPGHVNITWKYQTLYNNHNYYDYAMRAVDNADTVITCFPEVTDFFIIGSGLVGSATAYHAKKILSRAADVLVIDKDPFGPHNTTAISNGLISCQSKNTDLARLATLTKEFIRTLRNDVLVTDEDFASIRYRPCTHLILWPEDEVDDVIQTTGKMLEDGLYVETKLPEELESSFPFLTVADSDVAVGTHGLQDEAIIDPIALRNLYRTLAQAHGANFVRAEAIDFNTAYDRRYSQIMQHSVPAAVVRNTANGELRHVGFTSALLSLGHEAPFLESRAEMESFMRDQIEDMHFIQPKLRVHFCFNSIHSPTINFPAITDTDGSLIVNEDYTGNYKYYLNYEDSEALLDMDFDRFMGENFDQNYPNLIHRDKFMQQYFIDVVKPKLIKRIPSMKDSKFNFAVSGFESYNTADGNPVVGPHPYLNTIQLSSGYGPKLAQYGPAVGAILAELMIFGEERMYDITNLYWNRVIKGSKLREFKKLIT